jgi:hypothetical protein
MTKCVAMAVVRNKGISCKSRDTVWSMISSPVSCAIII